MGDFVILVVYIRLIFQNVIVRFFRKFNIMTSKLFFNIDPQKIAINSVPLTNVMGNFWPMQT